MNSIDYQPTEQTRQLWRVQLEIADVLLDLCKSHNLKIWACYGTLIGAARHKGYIPWDDDLDFVMMRPDYDRLKNLAISKSNLQLPNEYEFDLADISVIKLRRNDTTMLHPRYRLSKNINHGIWVDVFCLDVAPDQFTNSVLADYEHLKTKIRMFRNFNLGYYAMVPKIKYLVSHFSIKVFFMFRGINHHRDSIENRLRDDSNKYSGKKLWCFMIWSVIKQDVSKIAVYDISNFEETIMLPFEDRMFPCPKEYDKLLTAQYGDWRTPVMGASQHEGSYVDVDTPYAEYVKEKLDKMPWWKRYWYKH